MCHAHMQIDTDMRGSSVAYGLCSGLFSAVVFSCSVLEAGCPSSPNPVLGSSCRIPRGRWSSVCTGLLKNRVLTPARGCLSSRVDEPASESEGKQAKSKSILLPCPLMWAATGRCG